MWKNCTPLWREAHFQVKMYKTPHGRTTFWSWDVEKLHAAMARRTFSSQNRKKLTVSDHFLKLRCGKIARRCGEKHIFKSKCTKHCMFLVKCHSLKLHTLRAAMPFCVQLLTCFIHAPDEPDPDATSENIPTSQARRFPFFSNAQTEQESLVLTAN